MSLIDEAVRKVETVKYERAYQDLRYRMGDARRRQAIEILNNLPYNRGRYLDVGCGRGEMLDFAEGPDACFLQVHGTEVVAELIDGHRVVYGRAWQLPFETSSVGVVSMFDVMEHLLPGDDELACKEMARVARRHVVLTVSNRESRHRSDVLHINRRPYEEWHSLFRAWFPGTVVRLPDGASAAWRIDV